MEKKKCSQIIQSAKTTSVLGGLMDGCLTVSEGRRCFVMWCSQCPAPDLLTQG